MKCGKLNQCKARIGISLPVVCCDIYRYIKEPVRQEEIGRNPNRVLGITTIEGELDGEHQGNQVGQICPDL